VSNVEKLLKTLDDHDIAFVVIGGAAAVLHGSAYVTSDLDVCYSREKENLKKLATALTPFNPALRGAPKDLPFQWDESTLQSGLTFTLTTDLGDVDILGEVTGLGGYEKLLPFSEEMEIFGMRCKVLSLEGLIVPRVELYLWECQCALNGKPSPLIQGDGTQGAPRHRDEH
jgi:predicted nucleotidyltransferase